MGYYSSIEAFDLEFQSEELKEEFENKKESERSLGYNPVADNYTMDTETELTLSETTVQMGRYREWIPFLAKYLKGTMTIDGEDNGDIWRITFVGDGTYKTYKGVVKFEDIDLDKL